MKLEEILKSKKPVLIDFYSADCSPCLVMEDVLVNVRNQFGNRCEIYTIDLLKHPKVFDLFKVQSVPHFKLFKNGKPRWSGSGLFNKDELVLQIEKYL